MSKLNLFLIVFLIVIMSYRSFAQEVSKEEEALFVAQKAQEDSFYSVALDLYERFLKKYPESQKIPEVNLYIGQCYFFQKRFLEALSKFNGLLKDHKAESIRDACLYWIAEVHFRGNDFKLAASYYQKIIGTFSESEYIIPAHYSLGCCLYQSQDYADALSHFRTVLDRSSDRDLVYDTSFKIMDCLYYLKDYVQLKSFIESYFKEHPEGMRPIGYAFFYLAEAEYYLGNYAQAADTYIRTIKNTSDAKIWQLSRLGLGWSYVKQDKYTEAEDIFQQITEASLDKKYLEILLLGRGILLNQTQRFEDSLKVHSDLMNIASSPDNLLQAYLGKSEALYNLSRYTEALGLYTEVADRIDLKEVSPELVDKLYYNWAWAYLKNGQFKEAINEFQKVASRSNDRIVQIACLCLAADAYQDAGQYGKAIDSYDKILKDYPDSLYSDYIQYQLGLSLLRMANYEAAILAFKALLTNLPKSKLLDEACYALGSAYFQNEDYNSCIDLLEHFSDDFKDSILRADAMYLRASALYNIGRFPEAIEVFEEIIRSYNQDKKLVQKAEYEIADCFYRMGDEAKAVSRFKVLRSKYPDSSLTVEVLWWLGAYYYRGGKLDLAHRYFEAIIQDFPKSNLVADAYYALGSIWEQEEKFTEAIKNFEMVVETGEADLVGQATLAISEIFVKRGEFDLALKTYKQAGQKYPNLVALIYPKIAEIYKAKGDLDEAIVFYRKALEIAPLKQMNILQFKIAECLQEQRRSEEAVEEYLKVTYLYYQDKSLVAKALIRVGQIYEDRQRFKQAAQMYRQVLSMDVQEAKYAKERLEGIENISEPISSN